MLRASPMLFCRAVMFIPPRGWSRVSIRRSDKTGASLPDFVKAEFDAFLEWDILAHGLLRLRCTDCADEKLATEGDQARRIIS
jgi:hypothetical protein